MKSKNEGSLNRENRTGEYANNLKVGYNAFEFVLDFGQFYPENEDVVQTNKIITSPAYAKTFLMVFKKSIEKYEKIYGLIETQE